MILKQKHWTRPILTLEPLRTKLLLAFSFLLLVSGCAAPRTQSNAQDEIAIEELEEGVYLISYAFPWPANALLVEMKNKEWVLVDTLYTPYALEQLLGWMDATFGERKLTAINTHFHNDRIGGNLALIQRGIPIYGSEETSLLIKTQGIKSMERMLRWIKDPEIAAVYQSMQLYGPSRLFSAQQGLTLNFGQENVRVEFPGPGHSKDNLVVFFPSRKILFAGCLVTGKKQLGNTVDADLRNWANAASKLKNYDAKWVIAGHGKHKSSNLVDNTIKLLKLK